MNVKRTLESSKQDVDNFLHRLLTGSERPEEPHESKSMPHKLKPIAVWEKEADE